MPESGFAPAAGSVARQEAAAETAPPVEQPTVSESVEETLSRVTDLLTEQVNENFGGNLVEKFLQPDARTNIVREELIKLLTNEMLEIPTPDVAEGEDAPEAVVIPDELKAHVESRVTSLLSNNVIHDALHETHNRAIRDAVSNRLSTQLDPSIDAMIFESAQRIDRLPGEGHERVNACMNTHQHFLTFLDMVVRRAFSKLSTLAAPASITFEPRNVDEPTADGIKTVVLWASGRNNRGSTLTNGQHIVMQAFPWMGRSSLMMPEDADQETKDLIYGRRRLYVKAIIAAVAPTCGT